jgi:cysteinyl-tRNA synthetase
MAKSAGNFQRVTELADRGVDPLAFRYLTLTSRYGRKLNFSDTSIDAAAAALASLRARLASLGPPPTDGPWAAPRVVAAGAAGDRPTGVASRSDDTGPDRAHAPSAPLSAGGRALHDRFVAALDDDLDMPSALAVVRETVRADLAADERRWLVLDADAVLGLDLHRAWVGSGGAQAAAATAEVPPEVTALVTARTDARAAREYARADAIRSELEGLGWDLVDGPGGTTVSRR